MVYISLPDDKTRRLSFYLAMEEYVARKLDESDCFFLWQVEPTVIFGRNQLIENEVNVEFCRRRGIQMYRRKSGGGCVYADMSNIMFSYITAADNIGFTFYKFINLLLLVLRKAGVEATASQRNDVLIDDKKVSGSAFYHIPGRCIVHGTMLYDTDMTNMVGAITPDDAKLLSKGVKSVRQRIALLKDYIDLDIDTFKQLARDTICRNTLMLTADDVAAIEELETEYLSDSFIYGNNPKYSLVNKRRIEGVGELEARIEIKNDIIREVNLLGDFFLVGDLDALLKKLKGCRRNREYLSAVLPDDLSTVILNLNKEDFLELLLA
jgi:lipoic acid synthetase/lipoate-protein ligase A